MNIQDRVSKFGANGFMGFYSTLPNSSLAQTFIGLKIHVLIDHFDCRLIEQELIGNYALEGVFRAYFPISFRHFIASGGYSARSKDLHTTITGGDSFPIIHYSLGCSILPNVKNVGKYSLYDLEVSAFMPRSQSKSFRISGMTTETFPFLHPGSIRLTKEIPLECLEEQPFYSEIACRNGVFLQITHFSTFILPNSDKPPLKCQSLAQIFLEDHFAGDRRPIFNEHFRPKDGDSGELYVPIET